MQRSAREKLRNTPCRYFVESRGWRSASPPPPPPEDVSLSPLFFGSASHPPTTTRRPRQQHDLASSPRVRGCSRPTCCVAASSTRQGTRCTPTPSSSRGSPSPSTTARRYGTETMPSIGDRSPSPPRAFDPIARAFLYLPYYTCMLLTTSILASIVNCDRRVVARNVRI